MQYIHIILLPLNTTCFSLSSPVTNLMIVPMRVLMKVMRSLRRRSQRYFHVCTAFKYFVSPAYCSSGAAKPATEVSKKESSSDEEEDSEEESDKQAKLPTQNRHRKKYFYNLNYSIFLLFRIKWMFDRCIISSRPKLLPKTIVSLLDRRQFLLGIYPTV